MYVFRKELEGGHLCPCQHSSPKEVAFYPCHCLKNSHGDCYFYKDVNS